MGYRVYAGSIERAEGAFREGSWVGFRWVDRVTLYDAAGDHIEGDVPGQVVLDPVLTQEKNQLNSFECSIPYEIETPFATIRNPVYDALKLRKSWVCVEEDDKPIFVGRVTELEKQFDRSWRVYAEGALGVMQDESWKLDPATYTLTKARSETSKWFDTYYADTLFNQLFALGRADCGLICIGKVTVQNGKTIDTTDKGTQIDTHWNLLNTLFLDEYDGYLRTRIETSGDVWRICVDYLLDIEETTRQAIYYGSNLLDLTYTEKIPNDFATRITAYGSKTESHGWWIWKKYSTSVIVAVAKNDEAESKYGVVEKIVTVDGDTTEASLQETADKQLKEYKQDVEPSLMIEAFDYKDTGRDLDRLQFLKKTHVVSEPHGIDGWYVCTKTALTLDAPDNKRYEYGLPPRKLTDQQNANTTSQKTIKNQLRGVLSWLNK